MDTKQKEQVRQKITEAYHAGGWSQARLAKAARIAPNTVMGIVNGTRDTHEDVLLKVLQALGVEPPDRLPDMLDLQEVPDDVRVFLRAARDRLKVMPEDERSPRLNELYATLLGISQDR